MTRRTIVPGLRRPSIMNKIRTGETRGSSRHDRCGDHPGDRTRSVREASTDHAPWLPHPVSATGAGGMSCRYPVIRKAVELWSRSDVRIGKDRLFQDQLGEGFDDARAAISLTTLSANGSPSNQRSDSVTLIRRLGHRGSIQTSLEEPALHLPTFMSKNPSPLMMRAF